MEFIAAGSVILVIATRHHLHEFCERKQSVISFSTNRMDLNFMVRANRLPSKSTVPEPSESISSIIMSKSSFVILSSSSFKISRNTPVVM